MSRRADISTVLREGKRVRTACLDARVLASPLSHPRVGLIVPLHRHTAVDRNRLKRRMRELVRMELLPALRQLAPLDVSIRAKAEAYALRQEELRAELLGIRAHVTKGAAGP